MLLLVCVLLTTACCTDIYVVPSIMIILSVEVMQFHFMYIQSVGTVFERIRTLYLTVL